MLGWLPLDRQSSIRAYVLKSRTNHPVDVFLRRWIILFGFDRVKDAVGIVLDDLIPPALALEIVEDLDVGVGRIDFHDRE